MTLFALLFNQLPYGAPFVSREDMDYVLELADAYSEPGDTAFVHLRSALEVIDNGCSTLRALANYFKVTPTTARNRVCKSWGIALTRARCAVVAAELGRGFTRPPPPQPVQRDGPRHYQVMVDGRKHRNCSSWAIANAWVEGFNYAQSNGTHHNVEVKAV